MSVEIAIDIVPSNQIVEVTVVNTPKCLTVAFGDFLDLMERDQVFVVNSEAEMLALSAAIQGNVAVRLDENKTYQLTIGPSNVLANWIVIAGLSNQMSNLVTSVFGRTGAVVAQQDDYNITQIEDAEYILSFDNATLGGGILTITHGLNLTYPGNVAIWDDMGEKVTPDDIRSLSNDILQVYLNSYIPIQGVWKIRIGR